MNKLVLRTALTSVTALALFGGADILTNGNVALGQTVVAQAKTVSRKQFLSDVEVLRTATLHGSENMQNQVSLGTISELKSNPLDAYRGENGGDSISGVISNYDYIYNNDEPDFEADYSGLLSIYKQFRSRLPKGTQDSLDSYKKEAETSNYDDRVSAAIRLAGGLETAVRDYGRTITKVQSATKANKVYSVKAKKSGKYVIVIGKVTHNRLTKSALAKAKKLNRVKIMTYRGKKVAKINGQHKFKLKVYAPKAKTLRINAGGLNGSKYAAMTKTVKVKVR